METEELQLCDDYKTELRAEDVERILGLPREIQLALPHLKSAPEVEAHKLLTTYTLEYGEVEFAKADEQSQDHMFFVPSGEVRSAYAALVTLCYLSSAWPKRSPSLWVLRPRERRALRRC